MQFATKSIKMADKEKEFHDRVRQRFARNFIHNYYTDPRTEDEGKKVLDRLEKKRKPESPFSIQNICWFTASILVFYFTEFHLVIKYDERIHRTWFNIGVLFILTAISSGLYVIVWLSYIKKIPTDDWEKHSPYAIPVATICFSVGSVCVTIGLWPVWSILTPFILFTLIMGAVVIIAALPPSIF